LPPPQSPGRRRSHGSAGCGRRMRRSRSKSATGC
jgi:hypothetical protein